MIIRSTAPKVSQTPFWKPIRGPNPVPIDSYAIPRFIAILAVVLGAIWYVAAWSDQQPFKLLGAAGIIVFLINPFEMTKPLNAFERVMIAIGIGFALYVSIEPRRVARRLQLLRDWSHDEENLAL